ncbi:unnamed protein product [Oppiella nova]|uniref:C2H2-type domain-containing protein n=1 Tax=Oppiella nova TaxID=334625 RepID=A0A7R9QVN1_9ACAR|nr:unnamed protein product [Oppiella nova]CAG2175662.1 unnamed protein product [Oppiella nova]
MGSQSDTCFTRLFLKKYPLVSDETIDALITNGYSDKDADQMSALIVDNDLQHTAYPYKCEHKGCGMAFRKASKLRRHLRGSCVAVVERQNRKEKKYRCELDGCGKWFTDKHDLRSHERIHSGEMPFECNYRNCDKRFEQLADLQAHKLMHNKEKPFMCGYCGQTFRLLSHLLCHKRSVHTKEKPYGCKMGDCRQSFYQLNSLKNHYKSSH